ncbi:MAG: tRNA (N6-threonylcarbamoyladenosine(37)-N6)-methyltransferase TrmO [Dehalococcoidia bacterium]|nr:tRNA (N6-threonylcarbamoyladenosine(37)-N6)-methyltransferase TrmO [Dehalococcoidia bacterium]
MLDRVRRLFSRRREELPDLPEITLRPIGVVRSRVKETGDWRDWSEVTCRIVLRPELADALLGLDGYSHIYVLFWPHLVPPDVRGSKPTLHPLDDPANPLQGVLATRAQIRFNPVLVSAVRLLKVEGNVLRVKGLDAVDGSPVLDVKPYIPHHDSIPEAEVPRWVTERAGHH